MSKDKVFKGWEEIMQYYFPNAYEKWLMSDPKKFGKYIVDKIINEICSDVLV